LAVVAAGDEVYFHGSLIVGKLVAAGGVGFFEDFHLAVGEGALEVGTIVAAAAMFVDNNLEMGAGIELEGPVDEGGVEGEKYGGFVFDGVDHFVEFSDGQGLRPKFQQADVLLFHIVGQSGGGGVDVGGVEIEGPVVEGGMVPGIGGIIGCSRALKLLHQGGKGFGQRFIRGDGMEGGEDAALEELVVSQAVMQFFAVVDYQASGGALAVFTDALLEDLPEGLADEIVRDIENSGGNDQGT